VKPDHYVEGWYTNPDGTGEKFNFNAPVTKNWTVYAHWVAVPANSFAVTLVANGGTPEPDVQIISNGGFAQQPVPFPVKPNHYVGGWFTNPDGTGDKFDFNVPVTKNWIVYAHWVAVPANSFVVTFVANGGIPVPEPQIITTSNPKASSPIVEKDGFHVEGWYESPTFASNAWNFDNNVERNMTLYAKWAPGPDNTFLEFEDYVVAKWNNTFMLMLNKLIDEGYAVVSCTWYKNDDKEVPGFSYTEGEDGKIFRVGDRFRFVLTTTNRGLVHSTIKTIGNSRVSLLAYPNPVQTGTMLTIEGVEEGTPIQVFNQVGTCVSHTIATGETVMLTLQLPSGLYIIRTTNGEVKIIVNN